MHTQTISRLNSKPHNKATWKALWFGVAGILIIPALGLIVGAINMFLVDIARPLAISGDILMAVGSLALGVTGLVFSTKAFKSGERSWVMWAGLACASLVTLF